MKQIKFVETKMGQFTKGGPLVEGARINDKPYITLESVCALSHKSMETLRRWIKENNAEVIQCVNQKSERMGMMSVDTLTEYLAFETFDADNQNASQMLTEATFEGLKIYINEARQKGLNHIEFPSDNGGIRIRFDNAGNLNLDDIAGLFGVTADEIMEDLNRIMKG